MVWPTLGSRTAKEQNRTLEPSNVIAVFGEKILSEMGPKNGGFGGKIGGKALDFGFATPKRHFLARDHVV